MRVSRVMPSSRMPTKGTPASVFGRGAGGCGRVPTGVTEGAAADPARVATAVVVDRLVALGVAMAVSLVAVVATVLVGVADPEATAPLVAAPPTVAVRRGAAVCCVLPTTCTVTMFEKSPWVVPL